MLALLTEYYDKRNKMQYAHVGCPTCGAIFQLPLEKNEQPPWCVHANNNYAWRKPHPKTQEGPRPWTQMVRVKVTIP